MGATAVIVVHGVVPHPPYDMQDQCAAELTNRLPTTSDTREWVSDVWQPPVAKKPDPNAADAWTPLRTITRVYERPKKIEAPANASGTANEPKEVTADNPDGDFYDVIEAYWSPLDKGKTTAIRVISWMLRAVFLPLNTTARYIAGAKKKRFDICYVGGALLVAFVALLGSLWLAAISMASMASTIDHKEALTPLDALKILIDPPSIGQVLSPAVIWWAAVAFVGAFLLLQGLKALLWLIGNWNAFGPAKYAAAPRDDRAQRGRRLLYLALLIAAGIGIELIAAYFSTLSLARGWIVAIFAFAAGGFVLLRTLLQSFFVNFFGDVEIYTTHDQNSDFYALRELILTTVTGTIGNTITARDVAPDGQQKRRYDRVVILAHSLGSTITMDALIRLYTLKEQTKKSNPTMVDDFAAIRALVTFGTSLEKTRYFFDVERPTVSEAALQFENDQYGILFTEDKQVLQHPNVPGRGIFWTNMWYLDDPVANEILSYLSVMRPGESLAQASEVRAQASCKPTAAPARFGQVICYNQRGWQKFALTPSHIIVHGLYLGDDWFWTTDGFENNDPEYPELTCKNPHYGVLDVITAKPALDVAPLRYRERSVAVPAGGVPDLRDRF